MCSFLHRNYVYNIRNIYISYRVSRNDNHIVICDKFSISPYCSRNIRPFTINTHHSYYIFAIVIVVAPNLYLYYFLHRFLASFLYCLNIVIAMLQQLLLFFRYHLYFFISSQVNKKKFLIN